MQAMILAAGFGTRLLPYTQTLPKPLFPVLNKPLLLAVIERLQNLGFEKIIVNCHHLKEKIVTLIQDIPGIIIQQEDQILGTGGGLRRAVQHLDQGPVLVTNGDIYHSIDLLKLYKTHLENDAPVTMAMHDCPRFNSVLVENDRVMCFGAAGQANALAFTGIHVIERDVLLQIEDGVKSCIIDRYKKLLRDGKAIKSFRVDGSFWTDISTPADYLALHGMLLQGHAPIWPELLNGRCDRSKPEFSIDSSAEVSDTAMFEDWVSVGAAKVGDGCRLSRVVVWDNGIVADGSSLEDTIVL